MITNDFNEIMFGRKSIKVYDETVTIDHEEMLEMLNKAITAPSSVNLQPWRFVVVESAAAKAKLRPMVRFNTKQVDTASAVILIFADIKPQDRTEVIYDRAVAEGKMPQEVRDYQVPVIKSMYDALSPATMREVVKMDASLAAMQLMLVARSHGYDTNPMSGFDPEEMVATFDLDPDRYIPVLMVSIGKAKEPGFDSVRIEAEKITDFK
ncbi:TPA: nitroreductase family protein [Streptococcus suis]|uniref:nitroreductase family protein n=1 Tax=Streptococcus suis TaxID=1307 RepID=UPI00041E1AE4|nr:nitroreductase family protein [Streptococcus suis]MBY5022816.1 nitroreductase family protein [Streptococcus suis]HEL1582245.1 nitroreductase family protein [Streptococcus suis]HEL1602028.1 nitroreductase family protein [Streptococcus suis]HEL1644444.1 nitroreductase family protein [Streptococcus suis]HEL1968305.1 nitroreductase family protein [Streptococcus suis]